MTDLLEDEQTLRRISGEEEGVALRDLFSKARSIAARLTLDHSRQQVIAELIAAMQMGEGRIHIRLNADALGCSTSNQWNWSIPLPQRKPFREVKLRIDAEKDQAPVNHKLIVLLVEAQQARDLVLASPHLSFNQIAKRDGRCRTQLRNLICISRLSPRVVEAIVAGKQPDILGRRQLLEANLPASWGAQEQMLGLPTQA